MPPMTTEQLQQFLASADGQQLLQTVLTPTPEYNNARGGYMQPSDVGSQIANMSLIEDIFNAVGGDVGMLMSLVGGQFDYGLLEPVSSFDKEAPNTALLDQYTESGLLDSMVNALQEGYLPEEAAIVQYNAEFPNGEDAISDERGWLLPGGDANPRYKALLETAKSLAPEVAESQQYERQRAAAPLSPSPMGERFEEMGFSSASVTPDSYYDPNVETYALESQMLRLALEEQMAGFEAANSIDDRIAAAERGLQLSNRKTAADYVGDDRFASYQENVEQKNSQPYQDEHGNWHAPASGGSAWWDWFRGADFGPWGGIDRNLEGGLDLSGRPKSSLVSNAPGADGTAAWWTKADGTAPVEGPPPVQGLTPVVDAVGGERDGIQRDAAGNPVVRGARPDTQSRAEVDFASVLEDLEREREALGDGWGDNELRDFKRTQRSWLDAKRREWNSEREIARERASGRTIQSDQASSRLANFLMGR